VAAPNTARTGEGAVCRDCGGALEPHDPPDVHSGAMTCIRVLRQEVARLGLVVDAARGKGAHAETIAIEAETVSERIRTATMGKGDWDGAESELRGLDAALEAYRIDHPKPEGGE